MRTGASLSDAVLPGRGRVLVITTCASRKRVSAEITFQQLQRSDQRSVQNEWLGLIDRASSSGPAAEMYRGRSFGLAIKAASSLDADIGVISAGLGYVRGRTEIPAYDLTLRAGAPGSVRDRVSDGFKPSDWWDALRKNRFSTRLSVDANGRPLVLVCLSSEYARMVRADLQEMADAGANVRIFGLNISSALPQSLSEYVLPYDERLSAVGLTGTRVDFPQRALLHYVSHVHPSSQDLAGDIRQVEAALAGVQRAPTQVRERQSDDAIKTRIRALMREFGGKRTRILQHLRRAENVPCEQGRFSALYAEVQDETGGRQ